MDEKIVIYLVIGALYYGYKFFTRKSEQPKSKPSSPPFHPVDEGRELERRMRRASSQSDTPVVLQELLAEMQRQEANKTRTVLEQNVPVYENLESRKIQRVNYETDRIAIEEVNPYLQYRTMTQEEADAPSEEGRFAEYMVKRKENPLRKVFKDKNKVREAFVLSQVFERKW